MNLIISQRVKSGNNLQSGQIGNILFSIMVYPTHQSHGLQLLPDLRLPEVVLQVLVLQTVVVQGALGYGQHKTTMAITGIGRLHSLYERLVQ